MFRATDIIIEAFTARLREEYGLMFGAGRPGDADLIAEIAQAALGRIARSNALYHNLDHTVTVTMVASDIARGRMIRDGNVRREEWLHFVVSAMTFAIGFVRDVCP